MRRSTLCLSSPPAAAASLEGMARERRVQRALSLACCLVTLQLVSTVVHAQPLQASQVQFLQDCQTVWGQTFPGWGDSNPDCSSAEGVTCDSSGMISAMGVSNLNLKGSIPDSISNLRKISLLDVSWNKLSGSIPTEIGVLTNLQSLWLNENQLSGSIPAAIGNLTKLSILDVSWNHQLTGAIPTEIGNLTNLEGLWLQENQFSGSIPAAIGNHTKLSILDVSWNQLTGSIPTEIGKFTNLESLWLSSNQLSGSIPGAIGNLTKLTILWLGGNQLSGSIPAAIGSLTKLSILDLSVNQLNGSIPTEIGVLTNLESLDASGNRLTDSIPTEIGNLRNLDSLFLQGNQLSGSILAAIGNLTKLSILDVSWNQLIGSIPIEIGVLTNLQGLSFNRNQLSGSIPATIDNLIDLTFLDVSGNQLTGSIPTEIDNLRNLETLWLNENQLSGSIPAAIGSLTKLSILSIGNNHLTGRIPPSIGMLGNFQYLDLSNNYLTGPPVQILKRRPDFKADLSSNYLSGPWKAAKCSQYSIAANCFAQDRACVKETQRPPAQCTAFCGVSAKSSTSACDGRGICKPVGPSLVPTCSCNPGSVQLGGIHCIATGLIVQSPILPPYTGLTNGWQQQTVGRFMAKPVTLFAYPPGVTSRCGLELAFRVNFTFAIFPQNGDARSNGFAFVIAAKAKVGKPGGVGYRGVGSRSIAIVFETIQTNEQSDSEQHVGLNINGVEDLLVEEVSPFTLTIRAGYTAWVDYEPGDPGTIQVFLADSAVKPEDPLLQTSLSLCELLQAPVKPFQSAFSFGFVASTTLEPFQRYAISFSYVQTGAPSPKTPEIKEQALGLSLSEATFAPSHGSPFSRYVSADFRLTPTLSESWSIHDLHTWDAVSWLDWPVKNQNDCDACWAYAVVASVEAAYGIAKNGRAPQLSVESLFAAMGLTDADKCTAGGSPAQAFENLVALNADGGSGLTGANDPATRYPVQAFERAQFKGYVGLMLAVRHQPVLVHIEASAATFNAYDGTFKYQDPTCYTGSLNHVVLVIGYFILVDDGSQNRIAPPFWIIRNSWGEEWGDNGHMRMDIQGGDGVCGINVLPGIYPIIRIPGDPCGLRSYKFDKETETSMNPCGRFQCQTGTSSSNSNNCNCSIPDLKANSQPFVEVKNGYGSNTCAYVNVCGSYFKNPCYVGACINDGKGAYSCICPPNHVPSTTVDGFPTCDPANSTATTMTVRGDNWLCSDVYALVGLSLDEFTLQNAGIDCSQPLPKGSVLQLDGTPATPCTAFFYSLKGDTCESINKQLNYNVGNLATLNPGLDCSEPLKAGRSVCLERNAAFAYKVPECVKYGILTPEDTCDRLLQRTTTSEGSSKDNPWLALYRNNPGLTCSSTIPQSASAAGSKIGVQVGSQAYAHRLFLYATSATLKLFPPGAVAGAEELGPHTDHHGAALVLLRGCRLSPAELVHLVDSTFLSSSALPSTSDPHQASSSELPERSPNDPPRRTRRDSTPLPLVPPDARIFFSLSPACSMWRLASDCKGGSDGCASSAVSKLEEVLHVVGWRLREDMTAMDVGAAPGAWTEYLSARVRHVLAIDPAALSPAVTARGNVTHIIKMVEDAWDDVQAWSLACQADSHPQPQPTSADGHDINRVHEPGTDTAAPTNTTSASSSSSSSSTSGMTSSSSSSGIASSASTTPVSAGSSEHGGVNLENSQEVSQERGAATAAMCHGLFCDANKHPLQAAKLVAPLLPALASGGILVVTMKCRGRGRDKELLTQQLTEALPVSFRYAECVWLMANSVFERTFVGIKA
ncbi:unnamed protein product [Closterium sp. Yama58-4]|nr:unnamed protein product [Closterium sp. Yama58-4]